MSVDLWEVAQYCLALILVALTTAIILGLGALLVAIILGLYRQNRRGDDL